MSSPFDQDKVDQAVEETPKPLLYGKQRGGDLAPFSPSPEPEHKSNLLRNLLMGGVVAGNLGDAVTTNRVLNQGGHEMNPLLPNNKIANATALTGGGILHALLIKHLYDHGHPTIAKILGLGDMGLSGASISHNLGQIKQ